MINTCIQTADGDVYPLCSNSNTLAFYAFDAYSGCSGNPNITYSSTLQDGVGSCAGYESANNYCNGAQVYFEISNECDDGGYIISDPGYDFIYGYFIINECVQDFNQFYGASFMAECDSQSTIRVSYYEDTSCSSYAYDDYISTSCETNNSLSFDCSPYLYSSTSAPQDNTCDYRLTYNGKLPVALNQCQESSDGDVYPLCVASDTIAFYAFDAYSGCSGNPNITYSNTQGIGSCAGYGLPNNYCNGGSIYIETSTECDDSGSAMQDTGYGYSSADIILYECLPAGNKSFIVTCQDSSTLQVIYFMDESCSFFNSIEYISPTCESGNVLQFNCCDYTGGCSDSEPSDGGYAFPREPLYCPWIQHHGPATVIGDQFCNSRSDNNETSAYKWECIDYGMAQLTTYNDEYCNDYNDSSVIGEAEHCEGCGAVIGYLDGDSIPFDCSWYQTYNESACNRVDYVANEAGCYENGTYRVNGNERMPVITDICFGDGDGSMMIQCMNDTLSVHNYNDSDCNVRDDTWSMPRGCDIDGNDSLDFTCVEGNIPDVEIVEEDTTIYCPWFAWNSDGFPIQQVAGYCNALEKYSMIFQCMGYGAGQVSMYPSRDCSGDPSISEYIQPTESHCEGCGSVEGTFNGSAFKFDCSYYQQYDASNCDRIRWQQIYEPGCTSNNDTSISLIDVTFVQNACSPWPLDFGDDNELYIKPECSETGDEWGFTFYSDSSCSYPLGINGGVGESEICNITTNMTKKLDCFYGDIPSDSDSGSSGGSGPVSPVDEIFCPWYAIEDDMMVNAFDFCVTDIDDIDHSGNEVFIAEYYTCNDDGTMTRHSWISKQPILCSAQTPNISQIISQEGITSQNTSTYLNLELITDFLDKGWVFDCTYGDAYDASDPQCNILQFNASDYGCDESGELHVNQTSGAFITDTCFGTNRSSIQFIPDSDCNTFFLGVYNDSNCTSLDFSFTLGNDCANTDPSGKIDTLALEMQCIAGEVPTTEYSPVVEPQCPYYWGLFDEGPLIQPLNICKQDGVSNSSIVTCRGASTLIHTQYESADCTGTYTETEVTASQYRCDGVADDCDLLQFERYADCEEDATISSADPISSGEFILGICMANSFGSFTTTCDETSLQVLYYASTDCSGAIANNITANTGCDDGQYIDAVCDYTETTTTTTPAPVVADVNITFAWKAPDAGFLIKDPYTTFQATVYITVEDPDEQATVDITCDDCFIWQIMDKSAAEPSWEDIDPSESDYVFVLNSFLGVGSTKRIKTVLKVDSIRKLKQSSCFASDIAANHIFSPGNLDGYSLRVRVEFPTADEDDADLIITDTSHARTITTNYLPFGGDCDILNISSKNPLDKIYFECSGWSGNAVNLKYNGVIGNLKMSDTALENVGALSTRAPIGTLDVTILIVDDYGATTCYDISATFKELSEALETQTAAELTSTIEDILGDTALGEDSSVLEALTSVTDALYDGGEITQEEIQDITTQMTDNVLASLSIFSTNETDVDVDVDVTVVAQSVAVLVTLTANSAGVDMSDGGGGANILDAVEDVFSIVDLSVSSQADDTEGADNSELQTGLQSTADELLTLFDNIVQTINVDEELTDEEEDASNAIAAKAIEFDGLAITLALAVAENNEVYTFTKEVTDADGNVISRKEAGGLKTDPAQFADKGPLEQPKMQIGDQGMQVPYGISDANIGSLDITISISTVSFLKAKNKTYKGQSSIVSIDIYESGSTRRRRRRRLSSDSKVTYNASDCFPYFVFIDVDNSSVTESANEDDFSLGSSAVFPSCRYWDGGEAVWNPDGCFIYNVSDISVVCACIHLTTFQISAEDFVPEANILSFRDLRQVTPSNLIKYPTVWIVFVVFIAIFVVIAYCNPNKANEGRSIVAYEDMIYHDIRKEKMETDYSGKQVHAYSVYTPNQDKIGKGLLAMGRGSGDKMCKLHFNLFLIQLRNDHTLLSVIQRTAGTNFSTRQRLACFFMYLATIMVGSAIFYGVEQQGMGDITASFVMSLLSTAPVLIVKQLFMKAKPTVIKSTAKEDLDGDGIIDDEEEEDGPKNSTIRQQKIGQLKVSKTVADTLSIVEKKKMATTIRELNATLRKVHADKSKSRLHRIALVEKIRTVMFNKLYPLPAWCKKLAWCILFIWALLCAIIAIGYGIQFDLRYAEQENWLGQCWENYEQLVIERNLSEEQVAELQASLNPNKSDNFPGSPTSSNSWLMSLVMSIILSLVLWQPVTVYVTTWILLWMFTWNISMGLGPGSLRILFNKVCCHNNEAEDELTQLNKQLSQEAAAKATGVELNSGSVVAHHERPLDLIGFLGNDTLFLDRYEHNAGKKEDEDKDKKEDKKGGDGEEVELVATAGGDKEVVMSDSEERDSNDTVTKGADDDKEKEKEEEPKTEEAKKETAPTVRKEDDEP